MWNINQNNVNLKLSYHQPLLSLHKLGIHTQLLDIIDIIYFLEIFCWKFTFVNI